MPDNLTPDAPADPSVGPDRAESDPRPGSMAMMTNADGPTREPLDTGSISSDNPPPEHGMPRGLIILLALAATVVAAAGLRTIGNIIAPTFLALTLVITAHPLTKFLVRHRCPHWLAALTSLLGIYVVVLGLMAALALSIAQLIIVIPQYTDKFVALYNNGLQWLISLGLSSQQLNTALDSFDPTTLIPAATSVLSSTLGATSTIIFLITVLVFVVMDAGDVPRRLRMAAETRPLFVAALDAFALGVRRYWAVSAIFGAIVAVLDVAALLVIGVPLAFMWGLLSFITNFIPNIGFVLGVIPPALLALLDGGVGPMIAVLVTYSVLNLVVQVIIQPKFTGDAVGVTTTVSFLSLAFWAVILGPLGALLALPATLFFKTMLVDADPGSRWINALISAEPKRRPAR